ncbi:MAG: hypothetical protein HRU26_12030 [Psychroserpens sp.]|nr:hypothetical protein [Psychroserpens sp.]
MSTQLHKDFEITPELRAWADKACPRLDIDYYFDEFCDHWWSNGKKKKDWNATFRNWMRRTDKGQAPGLYGPDDKRIVRKQPRPVNQGDMLDNVRVIPDHEQYWLDVAKEESRLVSQGMGLMEAKTVAEQNIQKMKVAK